MFKYLIKPFFVLQMVACFGLLLTSFSAFAYKVNHEQIETAIRNSPNANAWLKQNASAIAKLAINVESGGETNVYNGSCCYGVLQMNTTNIRKYAGMSPEAYRKLDLQSQVNYWSKLTSDALQADAPKKLAAMSTFDGRPVTGELVLACVQLGVGNCGKSLNAGSCNAFADINGTNICTMADKINNISTTTGAGGSSSCAAADPAEFLSDSDGFGSLDDTNTGEYATMSPLEMVLTEADRRLGSDIWQKKLTQVSSRALWLDYTKVRAIENYLKRLNYEKKERIEAQLATFTAIRLENQHNNAINNAREAEKNQISGSIK